MSLPALLTQLAERNIKISLNGEQLRVQAPPGALTIELKQQIAHYKTAILAQLQGRQAEATQPSTPNALLPAPTERQQPFPLTDIQQAYWLGQVVGMELTNAYHMYQEIDCPELDVTRLSAAWQRLIERHDMLRAIILPSGQQQILPSTPPYTIVCNDISALSAEQQSLHLAQVRGEMAHQVFTLDLWPLFDLRVTRIAERQLRLHVSMAMIMLDAGSLFLLMNEWQQCYADLQHELPAIELSYRDYVLWNAKLEQSEQYQQAQHYWRARYDSLPPAPSLPSNPLPTTDDAEQAIFVHRHYQLAAQPWQVLQQRAKAAGVTATALLATAFGEVLALWSESARFTLNCTFFNRPQVHPHIQRIVGDFTAVTLLAVDHSTPDSIEGRAKQLQRQLWQDLEQGAFTGVRVIQELAGRQKQQSGPLMPTVFTSMIGLKSQLAASDVQQPFGGQAVYQISQTPQVSLDCQVREEGVGLGIVWDTLDALFPPGMIEAMFASYCDLLERLVVDESMWTQPASLAIPAAQQAQREQINDTSGDYPATMLQTLFVQQAVKQPNAPAILTTDRTLTYQEVYQRANQVAHWLRAHGISDRAEDPEQLVAIVMDKGWEQIVGVLGVLLAGAAYVPIDPQLPTARQHYLLEQSATQWVLTQSKIDQQLSWPPHLQRLCVDQQPLTADLPALQGRQDPASLAYVLYTSGSTGMPKGVMIEHGSVVNRMTDVAQRYGLRARDRALALTALHHDLSIFDIFCMLSVLGGAVVVPDTDSVRDPAHWLTLMEQTHVTLWNSVPAFMQMLVEHLEQAGGVAQWPASLRWAIFSGDFIPVSLPDRIRAWQPAIELIASGGPTETTVWDIYYPIGEVNPQWRSIPYGKPMRNAQYAVLNEQLQTRPIWAPGELYIAGVGLARGYWNDPLTTQARFLHHPQSGQRLYRSGDRGRYLPDGNIEILGRTDFQVKIRGQRIELGEIEAHLLQHPSIHQAVVSTVDETNGNRLLVAYVVRQSTSPLPAAHQNGSPQPAIESDWQAELSAALAQTLPAHMLPAVYVALDHLPLNGNGKVDRKALASMQFERPSERIVPPANELEGAIAAVLQEITNLPEVSVTRTFADLGLNSVHMVRINQQLQARLQTKIPIAALFEHATIQALAQYLAQAEEQSANAAQARSVAQTRRSERAQARLASRAQLQRV